MDVPAVTFLHHILASQPSPILNTQATDSTLGQLLRYVYALDCAIAEVTAELAAPRARETSTHVDYLALHSLSEFPAYKKARTSRTDEPLFADLLIPRPGDRVVFQDGEYIVSKSVRRAGCGDYLVTLKGGDRVSSSLLVFVSKAEVPKRRTRALKNMLQFLTEWAYGSDNPSPMVTHPVLKKGTNCPHCESAFNEMTVEQREALATVPHCAEYCLALRQQWFARELPEPKPEVRFNQVTPEDVDWAQRQEAFPHPRPLKEEELAKFFEGHRIRRERQLRNDRALQALAHSLGDNWASTHPEMEASMSYFSPTKMVSIEHAKTSNLTWGGRRVNLNSWSAGRDENDDHSDFGKSKSDKSVRDYRADYIDNAQSESTPKTVAVCLRCGVKFQARKGTKFCLGGNCRKRNWEEQRQVNNLPN